MPNRGGTHEQHVKAGQQSHKNEDDRTRQAAKQSDERREDSQGERGGSHAQHGKAGQQSHKKDH